MMKHIQGQRMNKKIELITFDLDDTLWDNMPTIRKAEIDTRKWIEDKVGGLNGVILMIFLILEKS